MMVKVQFEEETRFSFGGHNNGAWWLCPQLHKTPGNIITTKIQDNKHTETPIFFFFFLITPLAFFRVGAEKETKFSPQ